MSDPNQVAEPSERDPFSAETWEMISSYIEKLPEPVRLVVWGEDATCRGVGTANLCRIIADRFDILDFDSRPEIKKYPYHPVVGFMGVDEDGADIDYRIRFMGHPDGYLINSIIGAIQAVSFQGTGMEALTRLNLQKLSQDVTFELFTSSEDEGGVSMVTLLSNFSVLHPQIRLFITNINDFPQLVPRYSVYSLPHLVINSKHHLNGVYDQEKMLRMMSKTLKTESK